MSRISPKPEIQYVVRSWDVNPGMTFAVAEDVNGDIWISQATPVGTQFWTIDQAAMLPLGERSGAALREAILLAGERRSLDHLPCLPVLDAEMEIALASMPSHHYGGSRLVTV